MKWSEMGTQTGSNAVIYALLFGILMALAVSQMRKHGLIRRGKSMMSAGMVVVGVGGTVACAVLSNLLSIETAVWLLLVFSASGIPMMLESLLSDHQHEIEEELNHE